MSPVLLMIYENSEVYLLVLCVMVTPFRLILGWRRLLSICVVWYRKHQAYKHLIMIAIVVINSDEVECNLTNYIDVSGCLHTNCQIWVEGACANIDNELAKCYRLLKKRGAQSIG